MNKVPDLYEKLRNEFLTNPQLERSLHTELAKIVSTAYNQAMSSDEGYCFKFNLPLAAVNKLYSLLHLTTAEVSDAFKNTWPVDAFKNAMYRDEYYHILLLIMYYGVKEDKKHFSENALLIIMLKIWNGRKTSLLPYCDKRIMKYVVANMCTNRHKFAKYDGPLSMLKDYFVPSILAKYHDRIKKGDIQVVLSQAWGRIRQLFGFNNRTDIETGKKIAQGGILPLYIKAKEEGLAISSPNVQGMGDEDNGSPSFDQFATTSNRDEIINTTCEYITMSPNTKYPPAYIEQLRQDTKVKASTIATLLASLHNYQFHDILHDMLSIILSRTNISEKQNICEPDFMGNVKKNIISSKNNNDARKLQQLCDMLLDPIFKTNLGRDFRVHSNVNQIQLRKVIIYGIIYNLRKNICHTV